MKLEACHVRAGFVGSAAALRMGMRMAVGGTANTEAEAEAKRERATGTMLEKCMVVGFDYYY